MEQFRPTPDSVRKQNAPEAGAGPLGVSPPKPEQSSHGGGSKSLEHDLRGHGEEAPPAQSGSESTNVHPKAEREKLLKYYMEEAGLGYGIGSKLAAHRIHPDDIASMDDAAFFRIHGIGRKSVNRIREVFPTKVQSLSEKEIAEELRKARAVAERKVAIGRKVTETQRRNRSLTPEEREKRRQEESEKLLWGRQKRKDRHKSQPEQPAQVFPNPLKE